MRNSESSTVPDVASIMRDMQEAGLLTSGARLVPLTGGVSCEVWRVASADLSEPIRAANADGVVVKAPLATLRTPSLWQADVSRGFAEAEALQLFERLTPESVPTVLWRHPTAPVMVMQAAPQSWQEWREQMLAAGPGAAEVLPQRLQAICAHLGRTLATWHEGTRQVDGLPEILRTGDRLRTLRTDVFHRATGVAVPDISQRLEELARELESARTCLVHGDFSPKNVLVSPPGTPVQAWMLDAEVAHVGDPALDAAYLSTHLACKGVARPAMAPSLDAARRSFQLHYQAGCQLVDDGRLARHTGAIMAARVRGVSRVGYFDVAQQEFVLDLARGLVKSEISLDEAWAVILAR